MKYKGDKTMLSILLQLLKRAQSLQEPKHSIRVKLSTASFMYSQKLDIINQRFWQGRGG